MSACSPVCASTETCVDGQCKCAPNCADNSCGSDGCGGMCTCPSGQSCNNSTHTCAVCTPACASTCGVPDGCGGTCKCASGSFCTNGSCVVDNIPWEGWASTTQFGSGDPNWGNVAPLEGMAKINDPASLRMGGAVPWIELCNHFGSKQNQVVTTIDSASGKNNDKSCFLIQPINSYPDKIKGLSDPLFPAANMCNTSNGACIDINDAALAAHDDQSNVFPSYLIIPYEGCGGNCKVTSGSGADCVNDCFSGSKLASANADAVNGGECKWNLLQNPLCAAAKVMYNDGNWGWSDTLETSLMQYSDMAGISPATGYGRNVSGAISAAGQGFANYCTGKNMHFDIALVKPYWESDLGMGNIAQTTGESNIIVRYKRVPCNINGNIDIASPPDPNIACPAGFYNLTTGDTSCTQTVLKPNDPLWLGSSVANHWCCGTVPSTSKCGVGQVYQATGGACPCSTGQCFYNTVAPAGTSGGLCGQCGSGVAACSNGKLC